MDAVQQLWIDQYRSFRALPGWVQLWVGWLVGINLVAATDRTTPTGRAVARATVVFTVPNAAIIMLQRGWGSALSIPHLIAWPPLVVRLVRRLQEPDIEPAERRLAALVAVTNAISLAFDVVDAARFLGGERGVAGPRQG